MCDAAAGFIPVNRPRLFARVSKGGMDASGEVLDLTLAGCMIEWRGWRVQEQQRVLVSFPGLGNLPSTDLWADNDRLGLLFSQPLHEAVFEHLLGRR